MTDSQKRNKKVFISSTSFDLPEHRRQTIEACHRMDCEPLAMERMTAADATAVEESLRLVDQAEIYIGIFAHRYGFVPPEQNPEGISITEMEYNREVQRNINQHFSDLLTNGEFTQRAVLSEEKDEKDLAHLPGLVFRFNRRDLGRLRHLIDCINRGSVHAG